MSTTSTRPLELREASNGTLHFSGYASVTGVPYPVSFFTETIKPGRSAALLATRA